jgi:general secretion pathway protein F/type IV pilus assembly protein PilC
MPDFTYTARSPSGQAATGTLTATSEREVMVLLDQQGLFPVTIQPIKASLKRAATGKKIKGRVLSVVFAQLADLLQSGVPLLRSMEIIERQATTPALAAVISDVKAQLADGTSLADAMAKHPRVFNELTVSMVRAGQEGGFLEDVLQRTAEFTEHQEELRSKVVGALAYPIFLMIIGSIIVLGLIIFLVPRFEQMFGSRMDELPGITRALLNFSHFLQHYWWLLGILLVGGWFLYRNWSRSDSGRRTLDTIKLKIPLAGQIIRYLAISRFCRILGTMLHNGIPILTALRIAKDSTGNKVLADSIDKAAEHVTGGKNLAGPLAASKQFPRDVIEMIAVGEESNTLEKVLVNIANSTERRTTRQLDLMVRLLEPIMLLVMAGVTLFVVLALLLPFLKAQSMLG